MSEPDVLGTRLREAREACGLTIEDVADRMTVDAATVEAWERGETAPRPNRLHILSGVFGVPMGALFGVVEDGPAPADFSRRFERLEHKFEQMTELQAKLVRLGDELAEEIVELRKAEGRKVA